MVSSVTDLTVYRSPPVQKKKKSYTEVLTSSALENDLFGDKVFKKAIC